MLTWHLLLVRTKCWVKGEVTATRDHHHHTSSCVSCVTSVTHSPAVRVPLLCFYHILTSFISRHFDPLLGRRTATRNLFVKHTSGSNEINHVLFLLNNNELVPIRNVRPSFLYVSSPSLHKHEAKLSNFWCYGGREHKTTIFLFLNFDTILWNSTVEKLSGWASKTNGDKMSPCRFTCLQHRFVHAAPNKLNS